MGYGTVALFRSLSRIDTDTMSDSEVEELLKISDQVTLDCLTRLIVREDMVGTINGDNKKFYVTQTPIADNDFDMDTDENDILVEQWHHTKDETTITELTVASVDARIGLVELATAPQIPDEGYIELKATYRCWLLPKEPSSYEWEMIKRASVLYACYLAYTSYGALVPVTFRLGSLSLSWGRTQRFKPHKVYLDEFHELINRLVAMRCA